MTKARSIVFRETLIAAIAMQAFVLPPAEARLCGLFATKWGSAGSGLGQFDEVYGIAAANGEIYVTDRHNSRVQVFDPDGVLLRTWGLAGSGDGEMDEPAGVAVTATGDAFVVDRAAHRVQKFDNSGGFLLGWGSFGTAPGQFSSPDGIALDSSGNVYVADAGNHRIQKFDSSGTFLTAWGDAGSGEGQFVFPVDVAVDSSDNVYVADSNNHRVQKFDSSGSFLSEFGGQGDGTGEMFAPSGLAIDAHGNVFVADAGNSRIQVLDSSGAYRTHWGSAGLGDGQFPALQHVAVGGDGNVYVIDNLRVQKFACNVAPVCGSAPLDASECKSAAAGKSQLVLKNNQRDVKDSLLWKWKGGDGFSLSALKDPVASSTVYTLCVFDESSAPQLLIEAGVVASGTCSADPCWRARGTRGFQYKRKSRPPKGITKINLKSGDAGKTQVQVAGKGTLLGMEPLGLTGPVVVQFLVNDGVSPVECWRTSYETAVRNTLEQYKAKGP